MKQAQCNVYKSVSFEPDIAYMWYSTWEEEKVHKCHQYVQPICV